MNNSEYNFPTEKEQKIELASQILAISHTLISKGIVTEEEWQHTLLRARQRMDQKAKELQDAYDEQHQGPKERKLTEQESDFFRNMFGF